MTKSPRKRRRRGRSNTKAPELNPSLVEIDEGDNSSISGSKVMPSAVMDALKSAGFDPDDPEERQGIQLAISRSISSGPLPSADQMNAYDPETRQTILNMANTQQSHRLERETYRSDRAEDRMDKGQSNSFWMAILGVLFAAGLAFYALVNGGISWLLVLLITIILAITVGGPTAATLFARAIGPKMKLP